jgi:hypothetical protein
MLGSETQQGLESRHRLLAPIMAKDEFIKISLELMAAYAVMGSGRSDSTATIRARSPSLPAFALRDSLTGMLT